jgi:hypothetical protein
MVQECSAGTTYDDNKSHIFDPIKKITKIEVFISKNEALILQINFCAGEETLIKVGYSDDDIDKYFGFGRLETF